MRRDFFNTQSPFTKLIFAGFITLTSFLVIFFAGLIIGIKIYGISFAELPYITANYQEPQNLAIIKYFQIVQSIGLFIVPPFIIGYLANKNSLDYLKMNSVNEIQIFVIAAFIMISAIPFINFLADINLKMKLPEFLNSLEQWMKTKEETAKELTLAFVKADNFKAFLFNLLLIAIIPAIGEELLFRGVVQKICIEWTKHAFWGIFLASFLFSFLHFQFYGFVPRLLLGMLLGYLFYWSKSIWLSVFAHFINNGMAVFIFYRYGEKYVTEKIDKIGTIGEPIYFLIISILLAIYLLYYLKKQLKTEIIN